MILRCLVIIIFFLMTHLVWADGLGWIERRKQQVNDEISYFIYPLAYKVPGLGSGQGIGASIINFLGNGSTLNAFRIQGDIDVDSLVANDIPLGSEHFTLSLAYADGKKGGFAFYGRGPDSSKEPEFTLKFGKSKGDGQELNLYFFDRQLNFYYGRASAIPTILRSETLDAKRMKGLSGTEQEKKIASYMRNLLKYYQLTKISIQRIGARIDSTDDRIDPRVGVRFQYENYGFEGEGMTNYRTEDYSLTTYTPIGDLSSILVANLFYSSSKVLRALPAKDTWGGIYENCVREIPEEMTAEEMAIVSPETACRGLLQGIKEFNEAEANNSNATTLGGPNRLRSYPISRFYDKYSFFAGLEYRMYFLERMIPFNFILEKGFFEAMQLATFYEIGQVAPSHADLYHGFKYSAGVGLRFVFSSVVLRADYATGAEGDEFTVFIGYGF